MVAEARVVSAAAEPRVVSAVAEPRVASAVAEPRVVSVVAEPQVASAAAEPQVASVAAEPQVVSLAVEHRVVSVAAESQAAAAAAEPPVSVDIDVAFVVLVPVSVVVVEVDSSGRPKCPVFPNGDHFANSSSSVEAFGEESVHSPTGAHTSYGPCKILSNPGPHQNRNLEHRDNNPSPGYNTVSDTSDLPMDATTSHSRNTNQHRYQEQRKHRLYQASRSHPEIPEIQSAAVHKLRLHPGRQ